MRFVPQNGMQDGSVDPGTRLGRYEIKEPLGKGGMGEVYRARDTNLDRDVAIKVLPAGLVEEPARFGRFEREARLLASLSHPNIATVHGFERSGGVHFLTMELVEGPTLDQRLASGPLDIDQALEIALQLAAALEAAHRAGIVHRDLKPANVAVSEDGDVKLLDFGLAKNVVPSGSADREAAEEESTALTAAGTIVGTAPYMSPEQIRNREVDPRTDVWSFGCLLYETLSGSRPFRGETVADTVSAVLGAEPDWDALPDDTPEMVRWVIARCLEKDPGQRLHAIADARLLLEDLEEVTVGAAARPELRRPRSVAAWLVAVALALLVGASLGWLMSQKTSPGAAEPRVVRFSLFADPADPEAGFDTFGLSPDERLFFYRIHRPTAEGSAIHLRSLEDGSTRRLAGTERASWIRFSPDGEQIAFFEEERLKRLSLRDGAIETIVTLEFEPHAGTMLAWVDEGDLVISSARPRGLWRVDPADGELEPLALADPGILEPASGTFAIFPEDFPGPRFLLLTLRGGSGSQHRLELLSLQDGGRRVLTERGNRGTFVSPGFVAYYYQGKLFALPVDPVQGTVDGEAVAVVEDVRANRFGIGRFAVSGGGSLVYVPEAGIASGQMRLAVARPGEAAEEIPLDVGYGRSHRVSPDGRRVVLNSTAESDRANLWLLDLERQAMRRITGEEGAEHWTAWAPDGRLAFQSNREDDAVYDLYVMDPDLTGSTRKVLEGEDCNLQPQEWAPDGRLLYQRDCTGPGTLDVFSLDVESGEVRPLRVTPAREKHPSVSPDGQWLAFASDLSGEDNVYLTTYPEPDRLIQVSPAGGDGPIWDPSGHGLFFHSGDNLLFVPFDEDASDPLGKPEVALSGVPGNIDPGRTYDLFPDGRILLRGVRGVSAPIREVRVVLNWNREVAEKLAAR